MYISTRYRRKLRTCWRRDTFDLTPESCATLIRNASFQMYALLDGPKKMKYDDIARN
jgi:hypothetical protein